MNVGLPRRHLALAGLAAIVFSAAVGFVLVAYGRGDFDDTYELRAVFPTSSQGMFTDGGTEVKMRGINIGTVRGIELLPDGTVEAVFEGEDEAVSRLVEFCRRGPRRAEVSRVEVEEQPPEGLSGFTIR